ncbi:MAG: hypothetical protein WDM89_12810 [Rhizomicrobium sp.]
MSDSDIKLVRARREQIAKERAALDAEDADLDITERTLSRLAAATTLQERGSTRPVLVRLPKHTPSHKDMVLGTLKASPTVWIASADALQKQISQIHKVFIGKSSLFPYLSELKTKGVIVRGKNGEIALAERVMKEAAE